MRENLVLVRHGQSEWNKENRFTGWIDVDLSDLGKTEARQAGEILKKEGFRFDVVFTSVLKRAIRTMWFILDALDQMGLPQTHSWRLNERHYGALQGLDKTETVKKYGEEQVKIWRRSYDVPPPEKKDAKEGEPKSESLKDTEARFMPLWFNEIAPKIKEGKKVLVVAHGNSIRALVKYLDSVSEKEIVELNIPTGVPLAYEIEPKSLKAMNHRYLGNAQEIAEKIKGVSNQISVKR